MDNNHLIWLDLEMTGLNPNHDEILEIAMVITDGDLNIITEMPSIAIKHSPELFNHLDEWNTKHHTASGLIERCLKSEINTAEAEQKALSFVKEYLSPNISPMCGNSIGQDRRFLFRLMPQLERFFHYRNIDVSTIKELAKRWYPNIEFQKKNLHTALSDIHESIAELRFYREKLFINQPRG